jgi:uracil phosphoribosyltransferase
LQSKEKVVVLDRFNVLRDCDMSFLKKLLLLCVVYTLALPIGANAVQHYKEFPNLTVVNHPLVQHKLTILRDKNTSTYLFGQLLNEIALLVGYEVTGKLKMQDIKIETPVAPMVGKQVAESDIVIVPILRAGLGLANGLHQLIPAARQGHIGVYRDEETKKPKEYYFKVPKSNDKSFYIVVDPMLATGNSAVYAVDKLIKFGVPADKIIFMALVAAPEGIREFQKQHPSIQIFAAALDEKLNDKSYIVPGLGDAGDRLFGTR